MLEEGEDVPHPRGEAVRMAGGEGELLGDALHRRQLLSWQGILAPLLLAFVLAWSGVGDRGIGIDVFKGGSPESFWGPVEGRGQQHQWWGKGGDSLQQQQQRRHGGEGSRKILSASGTIDTKIQTGLGAGSEHPCGSCSAPPYAQGSREGVEGKRGGADWDGTCEDGSCLGQFYVQFRPDATQRDKDGVAALVGTRLGRYFPDDAHILLSTYIAAARAASAPGVVWVGARPDIHKLEEGLWPRRGKKGGKGSSSSSSSNRTWSLLQESLEYDGWEAIFVLLVQSQDRRGWSAEKLSAGLESAILAEVEVVADVRVASEDKLTVEAPANRLREIAGYISTRWWADWVERKGVYASRNFAVQKMMVLGGEERNLNDKTGFDLAVEDLDGNNQAISIADTGIDFDNCMFWQQNFSYPCFDPKSWNVLDMEKCPASNMAAMLGNMDFISWVETWGVNGTGGVPLMKGGRADSSSMVMGSFDAKFTVAQRSQAGLVLDLGDFVMMLKKWSIVRPTLLTVLVKDWPCTDCGGSVMWKDGAYVFKERVTNAKMTYEGSDKTPSEASDYLGKNLTVLGAHLFEKCFCYFATPSAVTVDPVKNVIGPVPPIRELMFISRTPFSAVIRKEQGKEALDPELLSDLCNITRGGGRWPKPRNVRDEDGVLVDICQTYNYQWAGTNYTWDTCKFIWDPRLLETAVSTCLYAQRLDPVQAKPAQKAADLALTPAQLATSGVAGGVTAAKRLYTYSTAVEWWVEYTRVPPFQQVDLSRRRVHGYYTFEGCSSCGQCERERVDSRSFSGTVVSGQSKMPVKLAPQAYFDVAMTPQEGSWRLDPFEARNVNLAMTVEVAATAGGAFTGDLGIRICVLPNSYWVPSFDASGFRTVADFSSKCLNLAGRSLDALGQNATFSARAGVQAEGRGAVYDFKDKVEQLPRRMDGWRIFVWNNGTVETQVVLVAKIMTRPVMCSDKKDGELISAVNTRTLNLGHTHVVSMGRADQCSISNKVYCDDSKTSGRQLDRCFVCGGGCFERSCPMGACPKEGNGHIAKLRYVGEYAESGGLAKRTTVFDTISIPCPSPTSPDIMCEGEDCNYKGLCKKRIETYPVDTDFLEMGAGEMLAFPTGAFLLDPADFSQNIALTITSYQRPDVMVRVGLDQEGTQGGGTIALPPVTRITSSSGEQYWVHTDALGVEHNITISFESATRIKIKGNATVLPSVLSGMTFQAPADVGTALENRQSLLQIRLKVITDTLQEHSLTNPYIGSVFCGLEYCTCKPGFGGMFCDEMRQTNIFVTFKPTDPGLGVVTPLKVMGRSAALNRGGHGTHIAGMVSGVGYLPTAEASESSSLPKVKKHDTYANKARLIFVDIGNSEHPHLTPPESLGDRLMLKPYQEGTARVFLNPWTCQDYAWWKAQDRSFEPEPGAALDKELRENPSVCNRYTTAAWEIDDFVARHPDALVIFPAGDRIGEDLNTVASPATCKNCLTIGTTLSWKSQMKISTNYSSGLSNPGCREEDCPQSVDKGDTCGTLANSNLTDVPLCCQQRPEASGWDQNSVDWSSGRGSGISKQSPFTVFGGNTFHDLKALEFKRHKPELVAPGVGVISARSDGDANSGGTAGCRCCTPDDKNGDTSAITAMSGSSMSAAAVSSLALLMRQYFQEGYYPRGFKGAALEWNPSAALTRALLVASAVPMQNEVNASGVANDISNRNYPNRFFGYGRPQLNRVLRLRKPPSNSSDESADVLDFGGRITLVKDHVQSDAEEVELDWIDSVFPKSGAIAQGETFSYKVTITGATFDSPFIATMSYTDPPGTPGAATPLVNDLDLSVQVQACANKGCEGNSVNESVVRLWGNNVVGGDPDNNMESVTLSLSQSAVVTVSVFAKRVVDRIARYDQLTGRQKIEKEKDIEVEAMRAARAAAEAATNATNGTQKTETARTVKQATATTVSTPCQAFAIVISGNLDGTRNQPMIFSSEPSPPTLGICGRKSITTVVEPFRLSELILGLSIGGAFLGIFLLAAIVYRIMKMRAARSVAKKENKAKNEQSGYLPALHQPHQISGVAKGGGQDFILLDAKASEEDGFYVGLPIAIVGGIAMGETSIIEDYDGRQKRAYCTFSLAPAQGSVYEIGAKTGGAMGYSVGEAGYIPVPSHLQSQSGTNTIYGKQIEALNKAHKAHGGLDAEELAYLGVGKYVKERTTREDVQAVHAGLHIKKPVRAADLFAISVPGMGHHLGDDVDEDENGYEFDRHETAANKQIKAKFWESLKKETRSRFRFSDVPSRNRTPKSMSGGMAQPDIIAPPLKGQLKEQGMAINGKAGYTRSKSTPAEVMRINSQNPRGEQFEVKTWESAEGVAPDDDDEVDEKLQIMWPPKQEPPSGTRDHRVQVQEQISATLTTMAYAKANGGAAANGDANGANGTQKKGKKKKKKVTKDLLAEAFGPN